MLYKKIKKILISILFVASLALGFKVFLHNKYSKQAFIPRPVQEFKVDMNSIRIKEVLNSRKIIALEISASIKADAQNYIKPRINMLNGVYQALTTTQLTLENNYTISFSYDISQAKFIDNGDNFTIVLNPDDIQVNIINEDAQKIKEKTSYMGDKFPTEKVLQMLESMRNDALQQASTQDNFQKTITNVQNTLIDLFQKIGVDTTKVKFQ